MPIDALYTARAEAHERLQDVERRFEQLASERDKLQAVVASLDAYLLDKVDGAGTDALSTTTPITIQDRTQPAWMSARDVLANNGRYRMTVPRIHGDLTKQGLLIAKDAVRIAMIRRTDIFDNDGHGNYGLVAWYKPVMNSTLNQDEEFRHFMAGEHEKETTEAVS